MSTIEKVSRIISIIAFIFYGPLCIFSKKTIHEFKRYGLIKFRKLVGSLEIAGALGLIIGFYSHFLLIFSSAGLAMLMFCGVVVRVKLKDRFFLIIPAFSLCLLNLYILLKAINVL